MNFETQYYKGIPVKLIDRTYGNRKAKRFTINGTNQNVWIPNRHLADDGTILPDENIDYVFRHAKRQLEIAGITAAIPGIKRKTIQAADAEKQPEKTAPDGTKAMYAVGGAAKIKEHGSDEILSVIVTDVTWEDISRHGSSCFEAVYEVTLPDGTVKHAVTQADLYHPFEIMPAD